MFKRNIATALLSFLGIDKLMLKATQGVTGTNKQPSGKGTRSGRNSAIRLARKHSASADIDSAFSTATSRHDLPSHIKLARKAAIGEIGLRGVRGLQVRRIDGQLKITH